MKVKIWFTDGEEKTYHNIRLLYETSLDVELVRREDGASCFIGVCGIMRMWAGDDDEG